MARATWKGNIPLGGMVTLQVEAFKGTEKYAGDEPLKQVCGCENPEPFTRTEVCAHGLPRLTEQGIKEGKTGTKVQLAAVRPDGSYAPLPADELSAIDQAINSEEIAPLALLANWTMLGVSQVDDLWYLVPNRKVQGSADAVAVFYAYLHQSTKSLIGRWNVRGRSHIVGIYAHPDGALAMTRLRYAQEIREPEESWKAPGRAQVDPQMVSLMDTLLSSVPTTFDITVEEDDSVARKNAAIQKALAGELVAGTTTVAAPVSQAPDLMAAMKAGIEEAEAAGGKPKRARKPAEKAKVSA